MCTTCGCGGHEATLEPRTGYRHAEVRHPLDHWHAHRRSHAPAPASRVVEVERALLAHNDALAAANRRWLAERGIFAVNLMSSPGSGKTTLLARTIEAWCGRTPVSVIEGDQQTSLDAERIRATGAPALQVNTGKGCHLDARMIGVALAELEPPPSSLLFIENVGNLVCPAAFDLGEAAKVVMLAVTEGEDKPLKYADMFAVAHLVLINKVDLAPYCDFDVARASALARRVRPAAEVIALSARTGQGFERWLAWLQGGVSTARARRDDIAAHPEALDTALPVMTREP
jgi:hydrogenase nickel incorporation protein HypB